MNGVTVILAEVRSLTSTWHGDFPFQVGDTVGSLVGRIALSIKQNTRSHVDQKRTRLISNGRELPHDDVLTAADTKLAIHIYLSGGGTNKSAPQRSSVTAGRVPLTDTRTRATAADGSKVLYVQVQSRTSPWQDEYPICKGAPAEVLFAVIAANPSLRAHAGHCVTADDIHLFNGHRLLHACHKMTELDCKLDMYHYHAATATSDEPVALSATAMSDETDALSPAVTSTDSVVLSATATSNESVASSAAATSDESVAISATETGDESVAPSATVTSDESVALSTIVTSDESAALSTTATSDKFATLSATVTSDEFVALSDIVTSDEPVAL